MHSPLLAASRLTAFALWTCLFMPPYALLLGAGGVGICRRAARIYWRIASSLVGLRIVARGEISPRRPTLFVANHTSYFDILVLGSLLPAAFVAKKEVAAWPGIGVIAKLGRTVFVDRRPRRSLDQREEMRGRLGGDAESLILFPEGTSGDGLRVLPFKSALLSVAEAALPDGDGLPVQPVSVTYTRLDGLPLGREWRHYFAWYGDMELAPHLWMALGLGRATVEVDFHAPVRLTDFPSRKALTEHCYETIRRGVAAARTGHGGKTDSVA